jgi:hypothetical protein
MYARLEREACYLLEKMEIAANNNILDACSNIMIMIIMIFRFAKNKRVMF